MAFDRLSQIDLEGFNRGVDSRAYDRLGAHETADGVAFAVWAPDAERVSVIGDFNDWRADASPLSRIGSTGVWHGIIRSAKLGSVYKYRVVSKYNGAALEKADPYGFRH